VGLGWVAKEPKPEPEPEHGRTDDSINMDQTRGRDTFDPNEEDEED
jgi:hypothetical protein